MAGPLSRLQLVLALIGIISLPSAAAKPAVQPLRSDSVAWLVFVDDLHISFSNTGRLRKLVRTPAAVPDPASEAHMNATRNSLRFLSELSGGFAILDGDDMRAAFQRIIKAIRQ